MSDGFIQTCLRFAPASGTGETSLPQLKIVRSDRPLPRVPSVHRPSLCFVAQGAKEVVLGNTMSARRAVAVQKGSWTITVSGFCHARRSRLRSWW